jgi:hypothetical protein
MFFRIYRLFKLGPNFTLVIQYNREKIKEANIRPISIDEVNLCVFGALPDSECVKVTRREGIFTCQSKKSLRRLTPLVLIRISKGGLLASATNRRASMSLSVIDLASV